MAKTEAISAESTKTVSLFTLASGNIGCLTTGLGGCFAEAASVCLEDQKHTSGVTLTVQGAFGEVIILDWESVTNKMCRCWADKQEATEFGACGIAILIIDCLTDMTVLERSCKGTGFDFWLGPKSTSEPLFQNKARLEISGILNGDNKALKKRVSEKISQTKRSDGALPAYVVVVEFGTPRSQVVKR